MATSIPVSGRGRFVVQTRARGEAGRGPGGENEVGQVVLETGRARVQSEVPDALLTDKPSSK